MSISLMNEGDVMGRGVPPKRKIDATLRARLKSRSPDMIAVLGAGPSGLLAAHAVALAGKQPVIISAPLQGHDTPSPARSRIGPATYLHKAIPDLTGPTPDGMVRFIKKGTAAGYALKVYGDRAHPTSWDKFSEGEQPAWDLGVAYDELWRRYSEFIIPMNIDTEAALTLVEEFVAVISTVPAWDLCENSSHSFPYRATWMTDQFTFHDDRDNLMIYDGQVGGVGDRFRASRIFGKTSTEYGREVPGARVGQKVQPTTCDCHPEIVRAGRWGEWRPGVLTHHAFEKVWSLMFDNFEGA